MVAFVAKRACVVCVIVELVDWSRSTFQMLSHNFITSHEMRRTKQRTSDVNLWFKLFMWTGRCAKANNVPSFIEKNKCKTNCEFYVTKPVNGIDKPTIVNSINLLDFSDFCLSALVCVIGTHHEWVWVWSVQLQNSHKTLSAAHQAHPQPLKWMQLSIQ